jgi:hypothetical protein
MRITRFVLLVAVTLTASLFASSARAQQVDLLQHTSHNNPPQSFVDKVRTATERFFFHPGKDYVQFLGCVSGPQEGAMGIHFVNSSLVGDGKLDVNTPEALIYEVRNGFARLVGVEYIVTAAAWHAHDANPPVLEGQSFQFVASPNRFALEDFYELHVWAWRDNPHGAFVDWNPRVSCEGK